MRPMTTLNRDAVPNGDVETGNEEEPDPEEGIPTCEMIQKNPTNRDEQELEDCGHVVYRSWCAVCVKGGCVGKENEQPKWWLLIAFSSHKRMRTHFQFRFVDATDMAPSYFWSISSKILSLAEHFD